LHAHITHDEAVAAGHSLLVVHSVDVLKLSPWLCFCAQLLIAQSLLFQHFFPAVHVGAENSTVGNIVQCFFITSRFKPGLRYVVGQYVMDTYYHDLLALLAGSKALAPVLA
jgi:hypothetical protein